jgi:regulator of RNase E activity RraA
VDTYTNVQVSHHYQASTSSLEALTDECLKATFFEIGKHATWHPEITKQVIDAGMTVGTHTWSHKDLARNPYAKYLEQAEQEVEMGNSAVHMAAAGCKIAPFFRFPELQHLPQLLPYLADRNIAIFPTDIDSRDFTMHKPDQVVKSVMSQLEKRGKGIILMHDLHRNTAEALPELFRQLKAGGYKVVHIVPKGELTTLPKYDEMVTHPGELVSKLSYIKRMDYLDYVAAAPRPSVVVIEDKDEPAGYGAFWGEVQNNVHKALGCLGTVTNGSIRDIASVAKGFQLLAGSIAPSHAYVHIVEFGLSVNVHSTEVQSGDLIHADRHGAVAVPVKNIDAMAAALDSLMKREARIIAAARAPGATAATIKAAMKA